MHQITVPPTGAVFPTGINSLFPDPSLPPLSFGGTTIPGMPGVTSPTMTSPTSGPGGSFSSPSNYTTTDVTRSPFLPGPRPFFPAMIFRDVFFVHRGHVNGECDVAPGVPISAVPEPAKKDRVLAAMSSNHGGPIDVGTLRDKHRIGVDGDGRAINSAHIWTRALFRMDDERDGPMCFEQPLYPDVWNMPFRSPVHLQYHQTGPSAGVWSWWAEIPDNFISADFFLLGGGGGPPPPTDINPSWEPRKYYQPVLGTTLERSFPSWLGRPLPSEVGQHNFYHDRQPKDHVVLDYNRKAPITGRISAFAPTRNGNFTYTEQPGSSRHVGGTASGGFVLLPPEIDLVDTNPAGVTKSNTLFVAHQGTEFGLGTINRANGTIDTGHSWGDGGNGEFLVKQRATTGGISVGFNSVRINNGRIAFTNLTNFFGEFAHSITANRTWTMPNQSGTVALEPVIRGTTTGETLQRGLATMGIGTTSTSVTFPTPYTGTPPQIQVTMERTGSIQSLQISSVTIFGFTVTRSAAAGVATVHWQAVGVV